LFETLVEALAPRLVAITFHSSSSSSSSGGAEEDLELRAAYLHALLAAIKRALAGKVDEGHADVAGYADSLVPVLYGLCVHAALHDGGGPATDARVVGVVGDIIGLVVQSLAPM
jgi:DNA repair/transcription protein MET18/MMS19